MKEAARLVGAVPGPRRALAGPAAALETVQVGVSKHSDPVAVSVSTSQYTNVTSASTRIADLTRILLDNPSTNSAIMHGHIGGCVSTAISTVTVKGPFEIAPASDGTSVLLAEDRCLWLVSRNSTAESVMVQGVSEKR